MANILIVDDDAQVRGLLDRGLGQKGYTVTSVPELAQALAKISKEKFDLVILDLQMRGENGATFLKNIRGAKSDLPIIIFSGALTKEVELEMRKAGANEVVSKGGEISDLFIKVELILKADKHLFAEPAQDRSLLVIDDDDAIRGLIRQFFSKRKYKVFEAADGEAGLNLMRREKVSCVLLDMQMPGMNGLDVLPKLLEINPKAGVVMISGEGDEQNVKKAVALGAYGYIMKPFDFVYLELTVASKLAIASSGA